MLINTFYRKYRPKLFKEIIGQEIIVNTLINSLKVNNCFIFSGTRGTGKTTIAKLVANYLNCLSLDNNEICLKCKNCLEIQNNATTDIIELDAASNNSVEDIRNIISTIDYLPQVLSKKVYIIDEAHMLSNAAWNSLLKSLEQLPDHVVFIFATTEFHKIPLTIISRCITFNFTNLDISKLSELIIKVTKLEKIKIDKDSILKIAQLANGSARDCLTILQQANNYCLNDINISKINSIFKLVSDEVIIELLNAINNKDINLIFSIIENVEINNNSFTFITTLINFIIDLTVLKISNDPKLLKYIPLDKLKKINLDNEYLNYILDVSQECLKQPKQNILTYFKLSILKILNKNLVPNNQNAIINSSITEFECFTSIVAHNDKIITSKLNNLLLDLKQKEFEDQNINLAIKRIGNVVYSFNNFAICSVEQNCYIDSIYLVIKNNKDIFKALDNSYLCLYTLDAIKENINKIKSLDISKNKIKKYSTEEFKTIFKYN